MSDETLTDPEVTPAVLDLMGHFLRDVPQIGRGDFMRTKNLLRGIRLERDPSLLEGQHFGRQKCHPGYRQVRSNDVGLEVEQYERA
jgi:hypothetical protein